MTKSSVELHREGRYGGVMMAWLSGGQIEHETVDSLMNTYGYDRSPVGQGIIWGTTSMRSSPRIAEARCQLVESFLWNDTCWRDGVPPEWLFMVDADMTWDGDALYQLLAAADPKDRPVMGGLCLAGNAEQSYPTVYALFRDEAGHIGVKPTTEFPIGEPIKVGATGAACLLIHRQVLVAMKRRLGVRADGTENPYPWFMEGLGAGGKSFGEDIGFCMNVQAVGASVWVHTGVFFGHIKPTVLRPQDWLKEHRS